jgi:hypothetical protein
MLRGKLFDEDKWAVGAGYPDDARPVMLYDAGIHLETKHLARQAGFEMRTSGVRRNNAKNSQSAQQRIENTQNSKMRIRVENYIGHVKQRYHVLKVTHTLYDLVVLDDWVFLCFILHNFSYPIIA